MPDTSESISSAELTSALHDGERLVLLPQSSTTVTNVCETVHVPYVNDGLCCLNFGSPISALTLLVSDWKDIQCAKTCCSSHSYFTFKRPFVAWFSLEQVQ